jgi:hypothetical protein
LELLSAQSIYRNGLHGFQDGIRLTASRKAALKPVGISMLALLQLLSGLQMLTGAIWLLSISSQAHLPEIQDKLQANTSEWVAQNAQTIFFWIGLGYLILGILAFSMVYGYLKGREWARTRGRSIAKLSILIAVLSIFAFPRRIDPGSPFFTILFNICVLLYLNSQNVKQYFKVRSR